MCYERIEASEMECLVAPNAGKSVAAKPAYIVGKVPGKAESAYSAVQNYHNIKNTHCWEIQKETKKH